MAESLMSASDDAQRVMSDDMRKDTSELGIEYVDQISAMAGK